MKRDCTVIVFARAPEPGRVKTRLAPILGDAGAARLAARMLTETLRQATAAGLGPVELCCTPDATHPAFRQAAADHHVRLTLQRDGDLGARMQRALARALETHRRALLIGTDIPGLDAAQLRAAARLLDTLPAVFAPVVDGGYALVGMSRPIPAIFSDIAWSTASVMAQTRARLRALGIDSGELPTLADVDAPADLVHVPGEWLA